MCAVNNINCMKVTNNTKVGMEPALGSISLSALAAVPLALTCLPTALAAFWALYAAALIMHISHMVATNICM